MTQVARRNGVETKCPSSAAWPTASLSLARPFTHHPALSSTLFMVRNFVYLTYGYCTCSVVTAKPVSRTGRDEPVALTATASFVISADLSLKLII